MPNKITITHQELSAAGYKRKEWFDKDAFNDPFDTLKFVQYEKNLNDEATIEVCYGYYAKQPDKYEHIETTCALGINLEYLPLQITDIKQLTQFTELIEGSALVPSLFKCENRFISHIIGVCTKQCDKCKSLES